MEPSTTQIVMFLATLLLGIASVGLRMSGYINRRVGLAIFSAAIVGMVAVVVWWRWPLSKVEAATTLLIPILGTAILLLLRMRGAPFGEVGLELDVSTFRHADITIAQLGGVSGGFIEHKAFEHCQIIGPAVLSLHNCSVNDCEVSGEPADTVWETPSDSPIGCVFMVDCRFYRCSFEYVGLAVPAGEVQRLRDELTLPATPQSPTPTG